MYKLKFTLQGLPPTFNSFNRKHWSQKTKEKNKWHSLVALAVKGKTPWKPVKKYELVLTRFSASEPDFDGLTSTWKWIIDGLIQAGVIDDDKLSNSGPWGIYWEKAPKNKGYVTIEVIEK